jgi:hypothetical protein
MEESPVQKLIFDFGPDSEQELSRKRSCSELLEEVTSEYSKKIRKQLQDIDLSSDSSSMDTDNDDDVEEAITTSDGVDFVTSSGKDSRIADEPVASTSKATQESLQKSQKVNIISVDIIKPAQVTETIEITDEPEIEKIDDDIKIINDVATAESPQKDEVPLTTEQEGPKKKPETNRILISDSEDDEEEEQQTFNNRRHSDRSRPSASAYSFAGVTGDGERFFRAYAGDDDDFCRRRRRYNNHGRAYSDANDRFNQNARDFQTAHAENMERIRTNVRMASQHAANAVRASTSAIPDLLSSFQDHFRRPFFRVADINQQIFGNFGRR